MNSATVVNLYGTYITLLKSAQQRFQDYATHVQHMRAILKHLTRFKGGRSLPRYDDVVELCKLKKLYNAKSNSKFQLLQRLVPHLITEIQEHDRSYVPPPARTNNAMLLFPQRVCATITEPAVVPSQVSITTVDPPQVSTKAKAGSQTCTTNKALKVGLTGVKTFKSIQEYRAFVRVGQHPMHASPCVCVTSVMFKWVSFRRMVES